VAAADALSDQVDGLFAEWDNPDTPGCAVGVMRDGALVYQNGYGMASLEHAVPISRSTVFRTGSVGKQFTAMAVLLAEAAGELSLDEDIRRYLPELALHEPPITIAHLIHHSSGLRDYLDLMYLAGFREEAHYDNEQVLEVLARQKTLNFETGTDYLYSNTGYFLLSQIIERATGKTLREWAEEAMFAPLGMENSHFHDDPWMVVPNRAYGYSRRESAGFQVNMTTLEMVGDGGVFTTIDDLVAWERNFIEPVVGGLDVLTKRVATEALFDGTRQTYAAGLSVGSYRGLPVVRHGGAFVGFRAGMVRFPEDRLGIYCLCNVGESNPMELAYGVADLYLADRLEEASGPPKVVPGAELAHLVGTWADSTTTAMLEASIEDGQFQVSFGGRPWTVAREGGELVLARDSDRQGLVVDESGDSPRLGVSREGRRPVAYRRVDPATPAGEALVEFVGRYESEELGVVWRVVRNEEGGLSLHLPPLDDEALEPRFGDTFSWDWGHAVFERDGDGAISGMWFGTARAARMWARRVAD
jgi:CubicO group peptidase (beta-lactamase class C family)